MKAVLEIDETVIKTALREQAQYQSKVGEYFTSIDKIRVSVACDIDDIHLSGMLKLLQHIPMGKIKLSFKNTCDKP